MGFLSGKQLTAIFFVFFLKLDAFSLFDNLYPSADSAISGIVTLLAAAQALAEASHTGKLDKPIMYSFFNGVSFRVVLL